MLWILLLLIVAGFATLWLWLDYRLGQLEAMFKVLAIGIGKAKDEVIEEVWTRAPRERP